MFLMARTSRGVGCRIVLFWLFTRQADTGLAHHKALPVDQFITVLPPTKRRSYRRRWRPRRFRTGKPNQRKIDAVRATCTTRRGTHDIEVDIAERLGRTNDLDPH